MSAVLESPPEAQKARQDERQGPIFIDPSQDLFKPWASAAMAAMVADQLDRLGVA